MKRIDKINNPFRIYQILFTIKSNPFLAFLSSYISNGFQDLHFLASPIFFADIFNLQIAFSDNFNHFTTITNILLVLVCRVFTN